MSANLLRLFAPQNFFLKVNAASKLQNPGADITLIDFFLTFSACAVDLVALPLACNQPFQRSTCAHTYMY